MYLIAIAPFVRTRQSLILSLFPHLALALNAYLMLRFPERLRALIERGYIFLSRLFVRLSTLGGTLFS